MSKDTPEELLDYNGPTEFIHLHSHSQLSILDGVAKPSQYAKECAERNWPGMAITEHGHMASVPDMHFEFKKYGLSFIPGCEVYYNEYEPIRQKRYKAGEKFGTKMKNSPDPKEAHTYTRAVRNRHLTLLAKNQKGFENLLILTTMAYEWGYYKKPRIWLEKLLEYREGIIVLSGCLNGPIAHEIRRDVEAAEKGEKKIQRNESEREYGAGKYIKIFKHFFGDDFYIELQMPKLPEIYDHQTFQRLVQYADENKIKKVLANDSHYIDRKGFELQKIMMAIAQEVTVNSKDLFHVNSSEQYFKTRRELYHTFKTGPYSDGIGDDVFESACDTTLEIFEKCQRIKFDDQPKIPDWKDIDTVVEDSDAELRRKVKAALIEKGLDKDPTKYLIDERKVTYYEQAMLECDRFIDKGFASYFLITADLIQYGKRQGWPFGPRGSAGGSLVCYLLGISSIMPVPWGLSFDRFLSSARGGYMLKMSME